MTNLPLAFGFGSLPMLGWLAAAAAPIIIHLWMRHTYREAPWAAMRFLQAAIKRQAKRLRLQQWILLALRTLILLLVALAAAKPFLSGLGWAGGGLRVHRLLVVDTSLSMAYVEGESSRLDRARELTRQVVRDARPGEVFSLITLADPPRVLVSGPVADKDRVLRELSQLGTTYGAADVVTTLDRVGELVKQADATGRPFDRHDVLVLTDLAKTTWQAAIESNADEATTKTLGDTTSITLADVGAAAPVNLATTRLQFAEPFATVGRPLEVTAELSNYGNESREVVAELVVDGLVSEEQRITVAADGRAELAFTCTLADEGWHRLEVRLPSDGLAADDQRFAAARVPKTHRVLCVEGRPGATRYLASAIDPAGEGDGPLLPVVIPASRLRDTPLTDFACVLLSNVPQLAAADAAQLAGYVRGGGGLAMFVGDAVDTRAYNQLAQSQTKSIDLPLAGLAALLEAQVNLSLTSSLLPVEFGPPTSRASFGIDPLDYSHPVAAVFRGREQAGLLTTPINRFVPLSVRQNWPDAKVALALSDGTPLLVTAPLGTGRVAVCGTAASIDSLDPATGQPWTLWPAWPSFLPVVRELVVWLDANSREGMSLVVNDSTTGLATAGASQSIAMLRPDERSDSLLPDTSADPPRWSYDAFDEPGVYRVLPAGSDQPLATLAVNPPASESDLRPVLASDLPAAWRVVRDGVGGSITGDQIDSTAWLHRCLLYAVLVLLATESLLANRWGRSQR